MAVFDIRSNLKQTPVVQSEITANTVTNGTSIDTAKYELGLMFGIWGIDGSVPPLDGTYTLTIQESDTGAFAGEQVTITSQRLIGATPVVSVANVGVILTQGAFSNLQFVRPVVTSAGVTNGAAIVVVATEGAEQKPEQNDVVGD